MNERVSLLAAGLTLLVMVACSTNREPGTCGAWDRAPGPKMPGISLDAALALAHDDVWAVGSGGPQHHSLVIRWDGSSWRAVATPRLDTLNNWLGAIAGVRSDDIWAAGIGFPGSSDIRSEPITQHWDGSEWRQISTPKLPGTQGALSSLAVLSSADVWAGGWFGEKGRHRSLIEHWDGRKWSVATIPNQSDRYAAIGAVSAVSPNDVWAVGYDQGRFFTNSVLHWDGASWTSVDVPPLAYPPDDAPGLKPLVTGVVARERDDVWIAATADVVVQENDHLASGDLSPVPYFVHWDGHHWLGRRGPVPPNSGVRLNGMHGNHAGIWAVGYSHQDSPPASQPIVYQLRESGWVIQPSPSFPPAPLHMDDFRTNQLSDVSVSPDTDAWAVGTYFTADAEENLPLVEHCN